MTSQRRRLLKFLYDTALSLAAWWFFQASVGNGFSIEAVGWHGPFAVEARCEAQRTLLTAAAASTGMIFYPCEER